MKYRAENMPFENCRIPIMLRFCYSDNFAADPVYKKLDSMTEGFAGRVVKSEGFEGKTKQATTIHIPGKLKLEKLILVGLGEKGKSDPEAFRVAAGWVSRLDGIKGAREIAVAADGFEKREIISAMIEGFVLGGYENLQYKSERRDERKNESLVFHYKDIKHQMEIEQGIENGGIISEGVVLARNLSSDPSNFLTPESFAGKAVEYGKKYKFSVQVLDEKKIAREKMGALQAVAQGSDNPPRFVILRHNGGRKDAPPIVLVGKGITFDSGGISIKPGLDMHEMKQDMTGGAVVLTTMITAARLNIKQNLVGLIPLAENMPSGRAVKPGDIIKSRKGITIEIINTDAEGRLILADALDYADKFKPQAVIDIATLTGATKYILGYAGAPIMGNNENLIDAIYDAAEATGERVWELPIWDRHREDMKSNIADLKNSGGPFAGTIKAAAFLENFIGDWPWGHIDIAYMDLEVETQSYIPKGPTGFGMRLFVDLLSNWKKL